MYSELCNLLKFRQANRQTSRLSAFKAYPAALLLAAGLTQSVATSAAERPVVAHELPSTAVGLVQAKVVDHYENDDFIITNLRIVRVYSGPMNIIDKWFEYRHPRPGLHNLTGPRTLPDLPEVGAVGIWSVKTHDDKVLPLLLPRWGVFFPSQRGVDDNYEQIETLAEIITEYQGIAPEDHLLFLCKHAFSDSPLIGYWAVTTIGLDKPELYRQKLDHFTLDPKLPISSQVALDRVLMEAQGEFWQQSDRRSAMMLQWLKSEQSTYETQQVRQRIRETLQQSERLGFADERQEGLRGQFLQRFQKTP